MLAKEEAIVLGSDGEDLEEIINTLTQIYAASSAGSMVLKNGRAVFLVFLGIDTIIFVL